MEVINKMNPFRKDDARLLRGCINILNMFEATFRTQTNSNQNLKEAKECLTRLAIEAEKADFP